MSAHPCGCGAADALENSAAIDADNDRAWREGSAGFRGSMRNAAERLRSPA